MCESDQLAERFVLDVPGAVGLLRQPGTGVGHVDAADGSIGSRALLRAAHAPQVHLQPVVAGVAVRHDAQPVVVDVHAAELAQPLAYFLHGGGSRRKGVTIQDEYPQIEARGRTVVTPAFPGRRKGVMLRAEELLALPVDDDGRRSASFFDAGGQMVFGVIEVSIPHQRGEVIEVGSHERGGEPGRIVAERVGQQDELAGEALDFHALNALSQALDPDLRTRAGIRRSHRMVDVQIYVIDQIGGVERAPVDQQPVLVPWLGPGPGGQECARPHAQGRQPPQSLAAGRDAPQTRAPRRVLGRAAEHQPSSFDLGRRHAVAVVGDDDDAPGPVGSEQLDAASGRVRIVGVLGQLDDALVRVRIQFLAQAAQDVGREPDARRAHGSSHQGTPATAEVVRRRHLMRRLSQSSVLLLRRRASSARHRSIEPSSGRHTMT